MEKFFLSFKYAFQGLFALLKSERNFQIHLIALIAAVCFGFYFDISRFEWIAILLISAAVLSAEAINSSIEKLCDHLNPEKHNVIKKVKDTAAGAVLILAIFAIIIGLVIFIPYMK